MKRWVVRAGATSLDQLQLEDVAMPEPGPGQVRVKVHAVSLNRRDELLLTGRFQVAASDFVPVSDGAGEIDAVGPGVEGWRVGDRMVGNYFATWRDGPPAPGQAWGLGAPGQDGMLTEYAILDAERITAIPATLDFEQAACLPCAALTAWTALHGDRPYKRAVDESSRVLVTGTGGVALFAILIGKAHGATVIATTSDDGKAERVKALGAAAVVNYRANPQWGLAASALGGPFDHVVNAAGTGALDQAIAAAAPGGEIALIGLYDFADKVPDLIPMMAKGVSIRGTMVGSAMALEDLITFIKARDIKPPIAERFSFAEAKRAYQAAASAELVGKTVIAVGS